MMNECWVCASLQCGNWEDPLKQYVTEFHINYVLSAIFRMIFRYMACGFRYTIFGKEIKKLLWKTYVVADIRIQIFF